MIYDFLIDTYATERIKVLPVQSKSADEDPAIRPRTTDPRDERRRSG